MDPLWVLLYFYYGGLIYGVLEQYDMFLKMMARVLTIPAVYPSAVMVDAYKVFFIFLSMVDFWYNTDTNHSQCSTFLFFERQLLKPDLSGSTTLFVVCTDFYCNCSWEVQCICPTTYSLIFSKYWFIHFALPLDYKSCFQNSFCIHWSLGLDVWNTKSYYMYNTDLHCIARPESVRSSLLTTMRLLEFI